ncbi:hypothetical protein F4781DRAFT_415823 [Annulohypoxylon bovei var. microspora]|nr:hypothetical protein F4781DRAFT_415823 [Annulohypoxylon bovei var. microspora]
MDYSSSFSSSSSSLIAPSSLGEQLCEPCYLIFYAERPSTLPEPGDQTPCNNCSEPIGGNLDEDWVHVDHESSSNETWGSSSSHFSDSESGGEDVGLGKQEEGKGGAVGDADADGNEKNGDAGSPSSRTLKPRPNHSVYAATGAPAIVVRDEDKGKDMSEGSDVVTPGLQLARRLGVPPFDRTRFHGSPFAESAQGYEVPAVRLDTVDEEDEYITR